MSIAIAIATRGMITPITVLMQPLTTEAPKIRQVIKVVPKIRNVLRADVRPPRIGGK